MLTEQEKIEVKHKSYISFILKKMKKEGDIDQVYNKLKSYKIDLNNKPSINKFIAEELIVTSEVVKKKRVQKNAPKKVILEPTPTEKAAYELSGRYTKYISLANPEFRKSYIEVQKCINTLLIEPLQKKYPTFFYEDKESKHHSRIFRNILYFKTKLFSDIIKVLQSDKWDVHPIEIKDLSVDTNFNISFSLKNDVIITYSNSLTKKFVTKNFGRFLFTLNILLGKDWVVSSYVSIRPYQNNTFCLIDQGSTRFYPEIESNSEKHISLHPYISNAFSILNEDKELTTNWDHLSLCYGNLHQLTFGGADWHLDLPKIMFLTYNLLHTYSEANGPYTLIDTFKDVPEDFRLADSNECKAFIKNTTGLTTNNFDLGTIDLINLIEATKYYDSIKNIISNEVSSKRIARLLPIPESQDDESEEEELYEEEDDGI